MGAENGTISTATDDLRDALRWAAVDAKSAREWLATPVPAYEDRDQLMQWSGAAAYWVRQLAEDIEKLANANQEGRR